MAGVLRPQLLVVPLHGDLDTKLHGVNQDNASHHVIPCQVQLKCGPFKPLQEKPTGFCHVAGNWSGCYMPVCISKCQRYNQICIHLFHMNFQSNVW